MKNAENSFGTKAQAQKTFRSMLESIAQHKTKAKKDIARPEGGFEGELLISMRVTTAAELLLSDSPENPDSALALLHKIGLSHPAVKILLWRDDMASEEQAVVIADRLRRLDEKQGISHIKMMETEAEPEEQTPDYAVMKSDGMDAMFSCNSSLSGICRISSNNIQDRKTLRTFSNTFGVCWNALTGQAALVAFAKSFGEICSLRHWDKFSSQSGTPRIETYTNGIALTGITSPTILQWFRKALTATGLSEGEDFIITPEAEGVEISNSPKDIFITNTAMENCADLPEKLAEYARQESRRSGRGR